MTVETNAPPRRTSPNVAYVGDIDRYGFRVTRLGSAPAGNAMATLEGVHPYNLGQICVVPISEANG